ncbi:hypothetical protein [Sphingomonas spermidinifaciens]|nr:hypothetical protein [Sphingomonas spermidinifaciens]
MDDRFFSIEHDITRRLARIELRGFWTTSTMAAFMAAAGKVLQNAKAKGLSPGEGHILVSILDLPVQDKALTDSLSQLIPMFGALSKRVALVAPPSSLIRLQAKRLVGANACLFDTEQEALDWLYAA